MEKDNLSPELALWAATIVVEDMKDHDVTAKHKTRDKAIAQYKSKLEMCGLKSLKKPQLQSLWLRLQGMPFVSNADLDVIRKSDKVDIWRGHLKKCLSLEGAKTQLKAPPANNAAAPAAQAPPQFSPYASFPSPAGAAARVPPRAAAYPGLSSTTPSPSVASFPPGGGFGFGSSTGLPGSAFMRGGANPFMMQQQQQQQQSPHMGQQMQRSPQSMQQMGQSLQQRQQAMFAALQGQQSFSGAPFLSGQQPFGGSQFGASPSMAAAAAAAAAAPQNNSARGSFGGPGPSLSRKRSRGHDGDTASFSGSDEEERDPFESMLASMQNSMAGGAQAQNSVAAGAEGNQGGNPSLTPVETSLLAQLKQMGFPDEKEILDAIRRCVAKAEADGADVPTSDVVMLDIISAREEAEEAKKMDQARVLSEKTNQEESQRLRDQRRQDAEERVLNATLEELRNPNGAENHRLMFPESWLLRYEKLVDLLTKICNVPEYGEAKKSLIEILRLEKKAKQWYKAGELPKFYFTCEIGERLLKDQDSTSPDTLGKDLGTLFKEMEQGILASMDEIPKVLLDAKEKHQDDSQAAGQNTGDDDDDECLVMSQEEVEELKVKAKSSSNPSAGLDTAGPVIGCD